MKRLVLALGLLLLAVTSADAYCFSGGLRFASRPMPPYCMYDRDCWNEMEQYRRDMEEWLDKLKCEHKTALEEYNSTVNVYNSSRRR